MVGKTISPDLVPGVHELVTEHGGRRYTLKLPESRSTDSLSPMITALHWGGPVTPYTGRSLLEGLVEPALEELGAIVLAPDRDGESWANPENEKQVLELIDLVEETFSIDSKRTLLTGYSLGGIGTWFLAGRNPGRFAAALPLSAAPPDDLEKGDWRIPFHVIHSRQDEIFPATPIEEAVQRLKERCVPVELNMIDGVTHFNVAGFIKPLAQALPWIRKVWG